MLLRCFQRRVADVWTIFVFLLLKITVYVTVVFSRGLHTFELFLYFCFFKITVVLSRGVAHV